MDTRLTGRVQIYDQRRCWGFIIGADGQRYFVHREDLNDPPVLLPGEHVEFEPVATRRGPRATKVRRVPDGGPAEFTAYPTAPRGPRAAAVPPVDPPAPPDAA